MCVQTCLFPVDRAEVIRRRALDGEAASSGCRVVGESDPEKLERVQTESPKIRLFFPPSITRTIESYCQSENRISSCFVAFNARVASVL